MDIKFEPSWNKVLGKEFEKPYFSSLTSFVDAAFQSNDVFPPSKFVFNAFALCPFDTVKVVILGQDPYHGRDQAHGLSFSVPDGIKIPPSLQNIYKEVHKNVGIPVPTSGNLEHWAAQGVLLLNATLTVESGKPGSHQGFGWETFTDAVIKEISEGKEHVVFLLWGNFARSKSSLIDESKHLILQAPHPSPFSAYTGFFGCRHFSKTNEYLSSHNRSPIQW